MSSPAHGLAEGGVSASVIVNPGKIIADLAVTLALGGDCLADMAVLRAEPQLFGAVASDPVVSRLISRLAADEPRALKAIRSARAAARQKAWELAGEAAPDLMAGWSRWISMRRS